MTATARLAQRLPARFLGKLVGVRDELGKSTPSFEAVCRRDVHVMTQLVRE